VRALESAGAAPLLIPVVRQESTLRMLYRLLDGLLLAGGVDIDPARFGQEPHPKLGKVDALRDWVELSLVPWAWADGLPVLGICRGIQTLNVARGGTLWQDITSQVPGALHHGRVSYTLRAHAVKLEPASRLVTVLGSDKVRVNSLHHQAIQVPGRGLQVVGRSSDGIIEAVEGDGQAWVVGVQWHPEWLWETDRPAERLFEGFVAACTARRAASA
jgi:putative glutamine amidotransferase